MEKKFLEIGCVGKGVADVEKIQGYLIKIQGNITEWEFVPQKDNDFFVGRVANNTFVSVNTIAENDVLLNTQKIVKIVPSTYYIISYGIDYRKEYIVPACYNVEIIVDEKKQSNNDECLATTCQNLALECKTRFALAI